MEETVAPEFHAMLLEVVDTEGLQYLAIRNALVSKLERALTGVEKIYIKRHLGRRELQRITEQEEERLIELAHISHLKGTFDDSVMTQDKLLNESGTSNTSSVPKNKVCL